MKEEKYVGTLTYGWKVQNAMPRARSVIRGIMDPEDLKEDPELYFAELRDHVEHLLGQGGPARIYYIPVMEGIVDVAFKRHKYALANAAMGEGRWRS